MKGAFIFITIVVILASVASADNLDVRIYKQTDDLVRFYGNIDVVPGEEVDMFIQIENRNKDRNNEDEEITDIDAILAIDDLFDQDVDEDFDDFDLNPTRKKNLPFSFTVPIRIEADSYTAVIDIEADEAGSSFSLTEEFQINIEKERHNLYFEKAEFTQKSVNCGEVATLDLDLFNIGLSDEEITLSIENKDIGFLVERGVALEAYPGDDVYRKRFPILIPTEASGKAEFEIRVAYGEGTRIDTEIPALLINCGEEIIVQDINGKVEKPQTVKESTKTSAKTAPVASKKTAESAAPQLLLLLFLLILIVLAILVMVIIVKRR
ncbi:hypothetical protein GOV09_06710 [Candidatus Woesearchaeota archaeon]|nr:hypothetical protein [Candidatus Woesearchaeota archaeon]